MTPRQARCAFSMCVAELILYASTQGYEIAIDEATERLTEKDTTSDHRPNSLHHIGLAVDLLLYLNGVYLTDSVQYLFLGRFWKELGVKKGLPLTWGGDFKHPDGNHFSLSWQGRS